MISSAELKRILDHNDPGFIESMAREARTISIRQFGRGISLYTPLYLSNYCENRCLYCGFNRSSRIRRRKLTVPEMEREMAAISATGIQNILLLTGESRQSSPVDYIRQAVHIAGRYFPSISLEIYPLERAEYGDLFEAGVDGGTIYQETYNRQRYKELHPEGAKADYDFRYHTPERIAGGGIRMISMGVLLGLSPVAEDVRHLFLHLEWMLKHYPGVEYSLSFPRLIPLEGCGNGYYQLPDEVLIKLICLARILFPRVGINLSTRERPQIRDHAVMLGVTRISAASRTIVGGYSAAGEADPQFEVQDHRSVQEIRSMLESRGYDPILTDWRRIDNRAVPG
jgi:2-iminoacetate synthase